MTAEYQNGVSTSIDHQWHRLLSAKGTNKQVIAGDDILLYTMYDPPDALYVCTKGRVHIVGLDEVGRYYSEAVVCADNPLCCGWGLYHANGAETYLNETWYRNIMPMAVRGKNKTGVDWDSEVRAINPYALTDLCRNSDFIQYIQRCISYMESQVQYLYEKQTEMLERFPGWPKVSGVDQQKTLINIAEAIYFLSDRYNARVTRITASEVIMALGGSDDSGKNSYVTGFIGSLGDETGCISYNRGTIEADPVVVREWLIANRSADVDLIDAF